ncbi:MAG: acetyl-CoA carboxylase carboxyltransferase subunit alpha [Pyrinomonadaceae bacterium]
MSTTEITAFDRVLRARHPSRPYSLDLFDTVFTDFVEIHGDRRYADDAAIVCGFARLDGQEVAVIGQQKGRDINQRRLRNFAMTKPEGYRKALRVMRLAEKFGRPIVTFIDTPGAYPGIDAEERGQAEAIAFNLREMAALRVPIVAVVLGEGGSGGALAIGIADRILMMENAVYSVISPEGCASILWKDASQAARAAACLRLTADDLKEFGVIDDIVPEPVDWTVEDEESFAKINGDLKDAIVRQLGELKKIDGEELVDKRYQKFRKMGSWI